MAVDMRGFRRRWGNREALCITFAVRKGEGMQTLLVPAMAGAHDHRPRLWREPLSSVVPGLDPGIHVFAFLTRKDVDGRDEPGRARP